jgi:cell division protein ZipA
MDELRWVLLSIGAVLIGGIYLWGIRGSLVDRLRKPEHDFLERHPGLEPLDDNDDPLLRHEPALGDLEGEPRGHGGDPSNGGGDSQPLPSAVAEEDDGERLNVVLTIMALDNDTFAGGDIARAAGELSLRKGRDGTLDCYADEQARGRPVFSLANVLEPGVFDWASLESLRTPGLVAFMRLPGPVTAPVALDLMLTVAGRLAELLQGVLCDDRRVRLTVQGREHLRAEVGEFERRRRITELRRRHG